MILAWLLFPSPAEVDHGLVLSSRIKAVMCTKWNSLLTLF